MAEWCACRTFSFITSAVSGVRHRLWTVCFGHIPLLLMLLGKCAVHLQMYPVNVTHIRLYDDTGIEVNKCAAHTHSHSNFHSRKQRATIYPERPKHACCRRMAGYAASERVYKAMDSIHFDQNHIPTSGHCRITNEPGFALASRLQCARVEHKKCFSRCWGVGRTTASGVFKSASATVDRHFVAAVR